MEPMSKDRVETFSDAVIAIILTLLVLELKVPEIPDHGSLGVYIETLKPLLPKFVSFIVTFLTIAIHWVNHHYFFRQLESTTIPIVWLNNFFLLWICFLPFPTAMLGDHPTDQFPIILYALNSLMCAVTFYAFRSYAKNKMLFKLGKEFSKTQGPRHSIPAIIIYTLAILLSFVNVYFSYLCFLVIPVLYFLPNRIKAEI